MRREIMNELKFPFKFKHIDEPDIFTASLLFDDKVKVSWVEGDEHHSVTYDISIAEHSIDVGYWKVVDEYGKEQDPDVVIKQSDYDSLVDEINMLRELVAELTSVKEEQQFKPISEMTLEDWVRAKEECWEFEDRDGAVCEVECVTDGVVMFHNYAMGFNSNGTHIHYPEQYSIVKRIK
jgi:hypothetical protein